MSKSTLIEYCASQIPVDTDTLPESTRDFLQRLALPTQHPFCEESYLGGARPETLLFSFHQNLHDTWNDAAITWFRQRIPPVWAFSELCLRLVAGWLAPVLTLYLLLQAHSLSIQREGNSVVDIKRRSTSSSSWCTLLALACSAIVMTDSN